MKQKLQSCCIIIVLCGLSLFSHAQALASLEGIAKELNEKKQSQVVSLKTALDELEGKYQISIAYKSELVKDKKVDSESISSGSIEEVLADLLKQYDLKFKKAGDSFYVIEEGKPEKQLEEIEKRNAGHFSFFQNLNNPKDKTPRPFIKNAAITVQGKVTSQEDGEALPGVNVLIQGTSVGTVTDIQGDYSISVPDENGILVFSFIGYTSQEVPVNGRSVIDMALITDIQSLQEVIVVGYGTQKKVNLTGAVSAISGSDLTVRPVGQTSAALQGLAPGVTVTTNSGKPGGDAGTIRIRGVGTLGNANPLVLIDGVEGSINDIDPNLIESISVLKDAASAAIYGSRASNGVVLVTTKRAKGDQLSINYNNYFGKQTPTDLPTMVNAIDHMLLTNEAYENVGRSPIYSDELIQNYRSEGASNPDLYPDTDWQKEVLTGSGFQQSHFVSLNGGSEKVRFITSLGYLNQDGVIQNSNYQRYTLRNNADIIISPKLNARFDIQLINTVTKEPGRGAESVFHWMNRIPANELGRNSNGSWGVGWNGDNPIAMAEEGGIVQNNDPFATLNLALDYQPVEWLNAEIMIAPKYSVSNTKRFIRAVQTYRPDGTPSFLAPARSALREINSRALYNTLRGILTFDKFFGNHGLKVLAGYQQEDYRNDSFSGFRDIFILPGYPVLNAGSPTNQSVSGGAAEWALQSFFGRINYDYDQKYLFEANARYDGSSRFSEGNKFSFFPSVSAGWRISEEPFMQPMQNVINELKLRASWGQLGNQNIGNYPFASFVNLGINYAFGGAVVNGAALQDLANTTIAWETTEMTDFGLDMTLFSNLSLTADYYFKQSRDVLYRLDIPAIVGLSAPVQNIGVVNNKGWEVGIIYNGEIKEFKYDINFNLSDVKNEVVDLRGVNRSSLTVVREGYPINSIFALESEGFFQNEDEIATHAEQFGTIEPGDIKYKDQNQDGIINEEDNVIIGSTIPRFTFGTSLNAFFKGFNLNIFMQGVGKADGYLYQQGIMPFFLGGTVQEQHKNHWTPENPNAPFPRLAFNEVNNEKHSDFWLKDASYLRLKNIQLGYTIPSLLTERFGITTLRFFVNGQNIFTHDNFWEGYDVEAPVGVGNQYPQVKMYSFGLNANF